MTKEMKHFLISILPIFWLYMLYKNIKKYTDKFRYYDIILQLLAAYWTIVVLFNITIIIYLLQLIK